MERLRPETGAILGGQLLEREAKTSAIAAAAPGRTSATAGASSSSRAIVVKDMSSSPHAVIQLVNGAGSRSTFNA